MQQSVNKDIVKKRFVKSIETYRENAVVQESIALKLINNIREFLPNKINSVFEIGSGTGILTEKILKNFEINQYYCNDIVEDYDLVLKNLSSSIRFIAGDIEKIEFPKNLDVIISSSTFQWLNDFEKFSLNIKKSLNNKDSIIALSSFGTQNFNEIRTIEKEGLNYLSKDEYKNILEENYEILYSFEEIKEMYFSNPTNILKHFKLTGVNGTSRKFWTKKNLKEFSDQYINLFSSEKGVRLTYNPIYFIVKPK